VNATERHAQLQADTATLAQIIEGLDRLDAGMEQARASVFARERGYFTPDEEDRVRQLLLAYRNYRLSTYEIIDRYRGYEESSGLADQLRGFIVGYAAALTLYAKSQKIVHAYRRDPLVRRKLNEPEPAFGLEAGFFDAMLARYTSLPNYAAMVQAEQFWRHHRREVRRLGVANEPGIRELCNVIRRLRPAVHRAFHRAVGDGVAHRFSMLRAVLLRPMGDARYGLQAFAGSALGNLIAPVAPPCFHQGTVADLRPRLCPGDLVLTRTERNLTSALLPGFWIHVVLYLGGTEDLERLGLSDQPVIRRHWEEIRAGSRYGSVVHAISPNVHICPLETCLEVGHVAVLRPRVEDVERAGAMLEALRHVGKPYDFEFDFSQSQRIVCTGLVYRSYHGRGPISFSLVKHLGRYTLTPDELCEQALPEGCDTARPLFDLAGLVLQAADGRPRVIPDEVALERLRAIQRGMKPSRDLRE